MTDTPPDNTPPTEAPETIAPETLETARQVEGRLVYAIGDVHGCYDLLKALLGQVWRDAAARAAGRTPELIFLGDYIDHGPRSAEVLDALVWLSRRADLGLRLLKGNHEQALLDFLAEPERAAPWLNLHAAAAFASYGLAAPPEDADLDTRIRARDALLDRLPASHLTLLQRLEMTATVGDYLFVHAGICPGIPLIDQTDSDLLSIREGFLDFDGPHERFVIHGHTWTDAHPKLLGNRLGLDTGAYSTGVLTAVRLEDGEMGFLQARDQGAV